jgi:hypothetical protein
MHYSKLAKIYYCKKWVLQDAKSFKLKYLNLLISKT